MVNRIGDVLWIFGILWLVFTLKEMKGEAFFSFSMLGIYLAIIFKYIACGTVLPFVKKPETMLSKRKQLGYGD